MFQEFRKFITRGNVIDLAVGIVIGAAFTSVVTSFVNDILMPPIGRLTGGVDFSDLYVNLSGGEYESLAAAREAYARALSLRPDHAAVHAGLGLLEQRQERHAEAARCLRQSSELPGFETRALDESVTGTRATRALPTRAVPERASHRPAGWVTHVSCRPTARRPTGPATRRTARSPASGPPSALRSTRASATGRPSRPSSSRPDGASRRRPNPGRRVPGASCSS